MNLVSCHSTCILIRGSEPLPHAPQISDLMPSELLMTSVMMVLVGYMVRCVVVGSRAKCQWKEVEVERGKVGSVG